MEKVKQKPEILKSILESFKQIEEKIDLPIEKPSGRNRNGVCGYCERHRKK